MQYNLLETAFIGLLHDIGNFYDCTKMEPSSTCQKSYQIFSEGTESFVHEYLGVTEAMFKSNDEVGYSVTKDQLLDILNRANKIASGIDYDDENAESQSINSLSNIRLSSIYEQVKFDKESKKGTFELNPFSECRFPQENYKPKDKEKSVKEYQELFDKFINDFKNDAEFNGEINKYWFDRFYALMYEYTSLVPALKLKDKDSYVSLFDHSKLTSAIASCLVLNDTSDKCFNMFEFDVSGIQKFIFKVTEGKDTKGDIAKSLRGRSFMISAITNIITYSYLYEFNLTESNIIFNTGGGALLLLPSCEDFEERINKVESQVTKALFDKFSTDISYVSAYVKCDAQELETFKQEKAITLKSKLEEEKSKKFHSLINNDFFYKKINEPHVCKMCGTNPVSNKDGICEDCKNIKELSEFFVKHEKMYLVYDFENRLDVKIKEGKTIKLGDQLKVYLISIEEYPIVVENGYDYIESLNHSQLGNTRWIANLVPQKNKNIKSFEEIANMIPEEYGDPKLGVLKMDVDNLGSIFAFGLAGTRSLSKFLTLSRLTEAFFGNKLVTICKEVSKDIDSNISRKTDNESMFYINYAGGDDLVIIGPVAGILKLAYEINNQLNKYTLNENITISAGMVLQSDSYPIRLGIQEAEEYLETSKNNEGKNSVTVLNTTEKMETFNNILKQTEIYKGYIINNQISRTNFYHLMKVLDVNIEDREDAKEHLSNIPKVMYSLKRNISKENDSIREILVEKILNSAQNAKELKKLVLEMKLTIMQTRE